MKTFVLHVRKEPISLILDKPSAFNVLLEHIKTRLGSGAAKSVQPGHFL